MESNCMEMLKSSNHVNNISNYVNGQVKAILLTPLSQYEIL